MFSPAVVRDGRPGVGGGEHLGEAQRQVDHTRAAHRATPQVDPIGVHARAHGPVREEVVDHAQHPLFREVRDVVAGVDRRVTAVVVVEARTRTSASGRNPWVAAPGRTSRRRRGPARPAARPNPCSCTTSGSSVRHDAARAARGVRLRDDVGIRDGDRVVDTGAVAAEAQPPVAGVGCIERGVPGVEVHVLEEDVRTMGDRDRRHRPRLGDLLRDRAAVRGHGVAAAQAHDHRVVRTAGGRGDLIGVGRPHEQARRGAQRAVRRDDRTGEVAPCPAVTGVATLRPDQRRALSDHAQQLGVLDGAGRDAAR